MNNMEITQYFENTLKQLNISDTKQKTEQFLTYYNYLIEYNKNVNLTAITEKNEVFEKHFIDSILPVNEFFDGAEICDVGTGAGFPSLPIAIVKPSLNIFAVDSLNKRIEFLNNLICKINIKNVKTFHSRAEDFAKQNREKFDFVVCRAVSKLSTLVEYSFPLLKVGGKLYAYKSINYSQELTESENALKILNGKIEKILEYDLPLCNQKRFVLVITKTKPTPAKYPRGQNKPKTNPL